MDIVQFIIPLVEITILAVMLNYFLSFFWNTRAMDLVVGFIAFLLLYSFAGWLRLPVLQKIMLNIINVVVLAVFIIFQPELRLALSRIGVKKSRKYYKLSEFDDFLESLCGSVYRLSEKYVGAIIILENQDSLDEYANKAVLINAPFSPELLESLFMTTTPLHDGAVIIRSTTIVSAATILPLADDSSQIKKSMGTRHRASLGISQITDGLSIVVSEEDGTVSIAREGMITKGLKREKFKGIIRSIFNPQPAVEINKKKWHKLLAWIKR
jgi:diadenylate cyclase